MPRRKFNLECLRDQVKDAFEEGATLEKITDLVNHEVDARNELPITPRELRTQTMDELRVKVRE
jgi:hypothetical protein